MLPLVPLPAAAAGSPISSTGSRRIRDRVREPESLLLKMRKCAAAAAAGAGSGRQPARGAACRKYILIPRVTVTVFGTVPVKFGPSSQHRDDIHTESIGPSSQHDIYRRGETQHVRTTSSITSDAPKYGSTAAAPGPLAAARSTAAASPSATRSAAWRDAFGTRCCTVTGLEALADTGIARAGLAAGFPFAASPGLLIASSLLHRRKKLLCKHWPPTPAPARRQARGGAASSSTESCGARTHPAAS